MRICDASKYVFVDGVKLLAMAIDACNFVEGTLPGYVFLFDMKGVKLAHLTRLNLSQLKKFFSYVQVKEKRKEKQKKKLSHVLPFNYVWYSLY